MVLPCWLDTFEFARRVEWLHIGVFGSPTAAPSVECAELAQAMMKVLDGGPEAKKMGDRAKELRDLSRSAGGRRKARDVILELLGQY